LRKNVKKATVLTFVLLAAALMASTLSFPVSAQEDAAIVVILQSVGGTTSPAPGTYTYANGTAINLMATPEQGWQFQYWVVTGNFTPGHTTYLPSIFDDPEIGSYPILPDPGDSTVFTANPASITCGYGYTYQYQAVFSPLPGTQPTPQVTPTPAGTPSDTTGIVVILSSVGGTTDPAVGSYTYQNGTTFTMTATASPGFEFHYWIARGSYTPGHFAPPVIIPDETEQIPSVPRNIFQGGTIDSVVFSDNPATIQCGFGYTYEYQAVFDPVNASPPVIPTTTPLPTEIFPSIPAITTTPTPISSPRVEPTPTPEVPTPTPSPPADDGMTTIIIVAVVVVIIIIILVAALVMRRK
jgi:hypothetical protein